MACIKCPTSKGVLSSEIGIGCLLQLTVLRRHKSITRCGSHAMTRLSITVGNASSHPIRNRHVEQTSWLHHCVTLVREMTCLAP